VFSWGVKQLVWQQIYNPLGIGTELCIGHAEDESLVEQHGPGIGTFIDIEKTEAAMRTAGNKLLDDAAALAAAEGIAAERRLLESGKKRVSHLIAEGATEWQADLIVVGTHGRHGFDRMVVGSVAEKLVRIAETSVLLVKADRPI